MLEKWLSVGAKGGFENAREKWRMWKCGRKGMY
jgi:hypothetical protein